MTNINAVYEAMVERAASAMGQELDWSAQARSVLDAIGLRGLLEAGEAMAEKLDEFYNEYSMGVGADDWRSLIEKVGKE